jgi:D-tyrosyl-tRNA(Tyr) deacylase
MRAVVQRVSQAGVDVEGERIASIENGLLVLLGVQTGDTQADLDYIVDKTVHLRIFADDEGKMNRDVTQSGGSILLVSQFTLLGDARHGRRPGFIDAAQPETAKVMYLLAAQRMREHGIEVELGRFMTQMSVSLVNDGPVTLLLDSRKHF